MRLVQDKGKSVSYCAGYILDFIHANSSCKNSYVNIVHFTVNEATPII